MDGLMRACAWLGCNRPAAAGDLFCRECLGESGNQAAEARVAKPCIVGCGRRSTVRSFFCETCGEAISPFHAREHVTLHHRN
jgi:hypothetical protein